ncbi:MULTISPECIES: hypothetical protein [unclassified Streptomyces]|uniref:hypothetical protein n=1 Tax=unclassified Streptomyces TaxID=2593676 RepID=UPI0036F0A853
MTQRVRHDERDGLRETPATVPGRDAAPGRGAFLEFLGMALAAGAFVLCVVRPEVTEALVHHLAVHTAGLVH